jgi:short-subunit dehydrogenase
MSPLLIKGSWVLVTGASSGLGKAAALHLARTYQAKPLIVGRRVNSLLELQAEIRARFGVACEMVAADQATREGREQIVTKVHEHGVIAALLAAGVTSVGQFDVDRVSDYRDIIGTNVLGFTELLAGVVGIFKQRTEETSIIAVSSLGGETSVPNQAVYGASKAYVNTLIQALSIELAGTGVSVGSFLPGGIDTGMASLSDLRWGKLGLMNVDQCAALAVTALVRRHSISVPGLSNWLTYLASRALPRSIVGRIAALPYRDAD